MKNELSPVRLMGIDVYPLTSMEEAVSMAECRRPLFSVNAEIMMFPDERFKEILNRGIGYPDGVGAIMALRKKGFSRATKIPGCELWLELVRRYAGSKSFYLVGGSEDVIGQTVKKLRTEFPGIDIKGFRNGFLRSQQEREALKADILRTRPDFVFVAMGLPRQEYLIDELASAHQATYMGLGGSFDVYTGNVRRAPRWWVEHNMEFLYRLLRQPSRIRRQMRLVRFLLRIKFGKF